MTIAGNETAGHDEAYYYDMFDLEPPEEDNTDDVTDTIEEPETLSSADDEGENEQEPAAPAQQTGTDSEADDGADGSGGNKQPTEERAKYAAARRKAEAERDAAVQQAQQDAERTISDALKSMGLTNPYTKRPITTKAEYDAYRERYDAERKAQLMRKAGLSDAEYNEFVANLPEVKEAREARRTAEAAAQQAQEAETKAMVAEQLKEIGALNPSIKTLEDLTKMPNYPQFYDLVKRGNSLTDAYKLANFDALTKGATAATRQAALNSVQSKGHLKPTVSRGQGAVSVPKEIRDEYRKLMPDATDAEIQQHYSKYASQQKGV